MRTITDYAETVTKLLDIRYGHPRDYGMYVFVFHVLKASLSLALRVTALENDRERVFQVTLARTPRRFESPEQLYETLQHLSRFKENIKFGPRSPFNLQNNPLRGSLAC